MENETIVLSKIKHKGNNRIKLAFVYNRELIEITKKIEGVKWSHSQKYWHVPDEEKKLWELLSLFRDKARIDHEQLNGHSTTEKTVVTEISEETRSNILKFTQWMRSRRYSESTTGTYTDALKTFLKFYDKKPIQEITNEDVIKFNNEFILGHKLSASYQNQVVNAIKLFFRTIENRTIDVDLIHRPKRPKLLPNVLSKEEVKAILGAPVNLKHKAMLSLIYSCGLRRGELLNLKIADIDSRRNIVIIRQSKGRKDRIAPLSIKIIELLRGYFVAYKPKIWLFEGQDKSSKYDERSLANVLKQAVEKSKIKKPVTLHWLRHSYATHLLENGTDLRYIQEILGHSRSSITEIYTHVSNKSIQKIISPFDTL